MFWIGGGTVPRSSGRVPRGAASLHYESVGEGPAVIFAHGMGGSHMSWWQQVPALAERFRCVTFAHRGFHPSTDPDGLGPDGFAEDLLALLDHLGIEQAALVGQSMGGWSCLEVALRWPERVRALVMSATSGTIDHATATGRSDWDNQAVVTRQALLGRGIHPAMGERAAREQPALHLLYRQIDEASAVRDKEALRRRLAAGRLRHADAVRQLRMPVLFVAGAEDVVFPPAAALALAERCGARVEIVPECGHSPYFERAELFNRMLAGFLA
ncbi:alpha/beta fold hydrolase [Roseomonas elaeocarpi]|uniref:Alpha/beta fold hydrolase n=1 Tax=Roseomonas elaeocarpi TaxID=907779 RepID=A0ABV6JUL0_9PROT